MPGVLATEQPRARERVRGCVLERGDLESFGTTLFSGETPCWGCGGASTAPARMVLLLDFRNILSFP